MKLLIVYGFLLAYAAAAAVFVDIVDPKYRCPRCGRLDFPSGHRCK